MEWSKSDRMPQEFAYIVTAFESNILGDEAVQLLCAGSDKE